MGDKGQEGVLKPDHPTDDQWIDSAYASRYQTTPLPKKRLPEAGMPAHVAYQYIKDLRSLDGNPRLDLASFTTTWMEPEAEKLIMQSLAVNYVDMETTPSTTDIQNRCVDMIANLFHAPEIEGQSAMGTATIGSSEAIMLGTLALKRRWEERRKAEGKSTEKPNIVMGNNVQVCWEKATNYMSIENRFVKLSNKVFVATPEGVRALIDENTIGVVGILGSTYTGEYEDIEGMDKVVEEVNRENGWHVGIHVDAASGGFIAPFTSPDLKWDFRLKNVVSINVSGHKYGLVYPGLGWVHWRSKEYLPESLLFHLAYLGADEVSFTMNFSKGGSMIIAQYYQFLRLGFSGYARIMKNLESVAERLRRGIKETGHFEIYSKDNGVPLVAAGLLPIKNSKTGKDEERPYTCFDVADKLRSRGWVVPAYHLAPDAGHITLLRCVVREDLSMSMADELIDDIDRAIQWLDHHFVFNDNTLKAHDSRLHAVKSHKRAHETKTGHKKYNAGVC
jgi:glutamate decarboxylase